jgi:APA family basic amino acid/polyamine antiporter
MVLLLSGTYEWLIDYAIPALWFFYALMVFGVMLLRRRRPDLPRPYRMWGYPITPLLFVIVAVAFIANSLTTRPGTLAAFGLIAAGVPVYFLWGHRRDRQRA